MDKREVLVSLEEYKTLKRNSRELESLHAHGVEDWRGYSEYYELACEGLEKEWLEVEKECDELYSSQEKLMKMIRAKRPLLEMGFNV